MLLIPVASRSHGERPRARALGRVSATSINDGVFVYVLTCISRWMASLRLDALNPNIFQESRAILSKARAGDTNST